MKIKVSSILLFIFLGALAISAQESVLYSEVENLKKSNVEFKRIIFAEDYKEKSLLKGFINPEDVIFLSFSSSIVKSIGNFLTLEIPVKNKEIQLDLIEATEVFYNCKVTTSNGEKYIADKTAKHYRGVVRDVPNSLVAISFLEDEIMGLIATDEGNFNIIKDRLSGKHILYNDRNLKEKSDFSCATSEASSIDIDAKLLLQEPSISKLRLLNAGKYINIYFETEYDMYQNKGSVSAVVSYVSGLFNQVATLYKNEQINLILSEIYVWNSVDPYVSTSIVSLLEQFGQRVFSGFNGNLGQLLTFRSLDAAGVAYVGTLCEQAYYNVSVASIATSYSPVPTFSKPVKTITHEFGHTLGSRHTHACVWNGNNTAIDGCYAVEGDCPRPGTPDKGTIMSYCDSGGTGIDFNLGFGQQSGNLIRNRIQNASCLNTVSISGPGLVPCSGTVSYSLSVNLPYPVWSVSNNLQILSGQGSNTITVSAVSSSTGSQSGTIYVNGGAISLNVSVGAYYLTSVTGPSSASTGSYVTYYAHPNFPASQGDYEWVVSPNTASKSVYRHMCDVTFNQPGSYAVSARSTSTCTSSGSYTMMTVSVGGYYAVSSLEGKQLSVAPSGLCDTVDLSGTVAYTLYNQATGALTASGRIPAVGGRWISVRLPTASTSSASMPVTAHSILIG
jgi:hypothetical protein